MTPAPRAFLLSDSADGALAEAAEVLQLDLISVHPAAQLPAVIDTHASARAIVVTTDDPSLLRTIVEHAGARRIPVILAGENDVAYRRAIEFRIDEWYLAPATPVEIARRSHASPRKGWRSHSASTTSSTRRCSTIRSPGCRRFP